jgi:hypothetical protein
MTTGKEKVAIGLTSAALVWGFYTQFGPQTGDGESGRKNPPVSQEVSDLSDADGISKDRMREAGQDGLNSELDRKNAPSEHRPRPRVRLRLP